jgi:uncharacterized repeat protein (TIGR03803 family)
MRDKRLSIGLRAALAIFTVALLVTSTWAATHERVLRAFNPNGADGTFSQAGLITDAAGNRYGTTYQGGSYDQGTVFELTPAQGGGWTEKVLYSFYPSATDGYQPEAGLVFDAAGNLYGTTYQGGTYFEGTAFELTPIQGGGWTERVLYNFGNGTDGDQPYAGLVFDVVGNLYGTTFSGGTYGGGTVFELSRSGRGWAEQVPHSFGNGTDGSGPYAGLVLFGASANLYGTTSSGGTYNSGTVFELTPTQGGSWIETMLHNFNGADGSFPYTGMIFDPAGNLYGTTFSGGGTYNSGTVFEIGP